MKKLKILTCTDFSSYSLLAEKAAENIRIKCNGTVDLIHVSEFSVMWDWMPPDYIEGRFELDLLNTLLKKMDNELQRSGLNAQGHVEIGIAPSVISQHTREKEIDLIIIGHKGHGGRFYLGGMAEKIISSATVPVLVVKSKFEVNKIAGLIDPNGEMDKVIRWTEDFTEIFKTKSEIVSLFPDISSRFIGVGKFGVSTELLSLTKEQKEKIKTNLTDKIKKRLSKEDIDIHVDFSTEKKVSYHLIEILKKKKVNLAIMKKHNQEFLEKILIGSETRRMLELFDNNLLILPV
jgi:nucleotide-binding universal stress UspA family protein